MVTTKVKNKWQEWSEVWLKAEITKRLINKHRVVMLHDDRQSLNRDSCFMNITGCSTQLPTQFTQKIKYR